MSACRSCGAEIIWARTENGKRMPLDAEATHIGDSSELRGLQSVTFVDGEYRCSPARPMLVYVSHFATCPNAGSHRQAR